MGHAVWHASTTVRILIANVVEVACDTTLCFAALCLGIQVGNIAERVLRVIGQRLLVMQHRVVSFHFLKTAK